MRHGPDRTAPAIGRRAWLAGLAILPAGTGLASWLPTRSVTIIVAYGPGSANDILVRLIQPGLAAALGQPVVIENRPGAGGTVGTAALVRARPDGHTIGLASTATTAINPALFRNLGYDPLRDLALIGLVAETPNLLIVPAESPLRDLAALAARLAAPGVPLRYSSPGNGTTQHLNGVEFARLAAGRAEHIPYRGPPEAVQAVAGAEVEFAFASLPSAIAQYRAGRVRALGITGGAAFPEVAEVPTLVALGYPALRDAGVWFAVAVPREVPEPILATLRTALAAARADPTLPARLVAAGYLPLPPRPIAEEAAFVARQVAAWGELVAASGARID